MARNKFTIGAALAFVAMAAGASSAEFEVASIRPNNSDSGNMGAFAQPGGRFRAQNVSLRFLIRSVYDVKDFQIISGVSSWIDTDRYDINAKAPEGTADGFEPMRPMLQALLAQRFKLVFHRETKELPVYDMVVAKGGLKLAAPKDVNCVIPDPKDTRPHERTPSYDNIRMGRGLIDAYGVAMPRLAAALSDVLGRVMVDKTGFAGIFDGHLAFTPDDVSSDAAPSIFTALQEQLGLRAESGEGPVEVLVVDHAERAAAN